MFLVEPADIYSYIILYEQMEGVKRMVAPLTADGGGKEDGCPFNSRWRGQRGWLPLEQLADCDKVQGIDKAQGLRCSITFEITEYNTIIFSNFEGD